MLSRVLRTESGAFAGALSANLPADTSKPGAAAMFSPRLVELCFQTAGVYEIGATGQLGLPAAVDRVAVWEVPGVATPLVAEVTPNQRNGLSFDARVMDADGRVVVEIEGYRTALLPGGLPELHLAPFRAVVRA